MKPAFLTREDVERLTKRKQFAAQRRELERLGIRFLRAADGEPLIRADSLDADGRPAHRAPSGPRWDRIASVRQLKPRAA